MGSNQQWPLLVSLEVSFYVESRVNSKKKNIEKQGKTQSQINVNKCFQWARTHYHFNWKYLAQLSTLFLPSHETKTHLLMAANGAQGVSSRQAIEQEKIYRRKSLRLFGLGRRL